MAKPNYAYEKRQRELEKKKKREDKAMKKTSPTDSPDAGSAGTPAETEAPSGQLADPPAQ